MSKTIGAIGVKKNFVIYVSSVILVVALFSLFGLTESSLIDNLAKYDVLPSMLETVKGAFFRFYWFLPIVVVASVSIISLDKQLRQTQDRKLLILTAVIVSVSLSWIVLTRVLQFPLCGDDSYIDFRYIRNWVASSSFDYNPGERLIGFTSHIHLLLLYLVCSLFKSIDVALISQMVNVGLQLINSVVIYFFLKDIFKSRVSALSGLFVYALDPYGVQQTVFGKETHLLIFFVLTCMWAMYRSRYNLVAWISSCIPFIRPEGVIWWLICLLWSLKEQKGKSIRYYLAPSIVVLVVVVLLYITFHTIIPHGMVGKFKMFYPMSPGLMLFNSLWMIGTGVFIPKFYLVNPGVIYALGGMILGVVSLVFFYRLLKESVFRWYLAAVVTYLIVFGIKNPATFGWYQAWYSLVPVFLIAAIFPKVFTVSMSSGYSAKKVVSIVSMMLLLSVQIGQQFKRPSFDLSSMTFEWTLEFKRLVQFDYALNKLKQYPNWQNKTIGTAEIGYIGYRYPGRILDFCGLLSPEVVKLGRLPDKYQAEGEVFEINPKAVKDFKPDYVITLEAFAKELLKDSYFLDNYEKIAEYDNSWANSKGILVYRYIN